MVIEINLQRLGQKYLDALNSRDAACLTQGSGGLGCRLIAAGNSGRSPAAVHFEFCIDNAEANLTEGRLRMLEQHLNDSFSDYYTEIIFITQNFPGNRFLRAFSGLDRVEHGKLLMALRVTPMECLRGNPESLPVICGRVFPDGCTCRVFQSSETDELWDGQVLALIPQDPEKRTEVMGEFSANADVFGWHLVHSTTIQSMTAKLDTVVFEMGMVRRKREA